jgi:hypothetical protein
VEPVCVLVGRCGAVLVAVGEHDCGVHVQHHHPGADVAARRTGHRWATKQFPQPDPGLGPRLADAPQPHLIDLVQRSPYRGVRGHLPEHLVLVAQHVDVRDRLTAVGDHHGQIDQHPAPVMHRPPPSPGQRTRHSARQPRAISQHPQQRRADMRHHTRTVRGDPQILRPRRRLHFGSASLQRNLSMSQSQVSLTGEVLSLIYTPDNGAP